MRAFIGRCMALFACVFALPGQVALAQTAAAPPPIADFFKDAAFRNPVLSPDGKFVAAAAASADGKGTFLMMIDLDRPQQSKFIAGFVEADVARVAWVSSERLVFDVRRRQDGDSGPLHSAGLWAVNRDGSDEIMLIEPQYALSGSKSGRHLRSKTLPYNWELHSVPQDGSDEVLVRGYVWDTSGDLLSTKLARLNVNTSALRPLTDGVPPNVTGWSTDVHGNPVALHAFKDGQHTSYMKDAQGHWQRWQSGAGYTSDYDSPFFFSEGLALVTAISEQGFESLYRFDPVSRKREDKPLISTPGFDFAGEAIYDAESRQLLGLHFETDAEDTLWLHPRMREIQAAVDKLLPGRVNTLQCRDCLNTRRMIVSSVSDVQPYEYLLLDVPSMKLSLLAAARPWIKARQMGQRDFLRFKARDGREIPVLVTQPAGPAKAARPAVMLVHGGPYVRGTHWAWEPMAQFLASRGYVVIEPEFRGSTGYGSAHFRAGWKQWGLAMQDDVADAMDWAVAKGWVDPQRVCIAGASYGGYATLMGLIKHPDKYKCGINWVGVSDIELMYTISWSDFGSEWKNYGMPVLVGDREKDAAQLKATSPLAQAHRLKQPLLMAYGGEDRRVPYKHGTAFRDAVQEVNPAVEWVVYPNEGHGWRYLETNLDFWSRVERLLDRQIGAGAERR